MSSDMTHLLLLLSMVREKEPTLPDVLARFDHKASLSAAYLQGFEAAMRMIQEAQAELDERSKAV